jgi:hypothetical protein
MTESGMSKAPATKTVAAPGRVVGIASEKGGVGKSVLARTFVDWLRTNNYPVAAYDADGGVGALLRVLGTRDANGVLVKDQDPSTGVGYYSCRDHAERSKLLDSIASGASFYAHDTPGGALTDLTWIVDGGEGLRGLLDAFEAHDYRFTVLHVLSPDLSATQSIARWLELTEGRADHVAVVNMRHGKPPQDFPYWGGFTTASGVHKGGRTREKLLADGGLEVNFPALPPGTFAKIDNENLPFSKAAEAGLLTVTERAHVSKFLRDFASAFAPVFELLGLR